MKHLKKLVTGISSGAILLSAFSAAAATSYPGNYDKRCRLNQSDAYDLGWIFPAQAKSPYRGRCLDTSIKRPAFLLQLNSEGFRFANFHYQGKFYEIAIPRMSVEKVIFNTEHFKPVGPIKPAHTQLRFVLNKDAKLIYQYGSRKGQVYKNIRDFILSVDYMVPRGVPYRPIEGIKIPFLKENYMNAYRFISTQDRYEDRVLKVGRTIQQYLLELSDEEKDATLKYAVHFSHQKQAHEVYSLSSRNCTTELFRVLGQATKNPALSWYVTPDAILDPVAGQSVDLLVKAGLIRYELPTMNEEFAR